MICGDCIHKEVCRLEGHFDDALITCKYKVDLPHNTGHWINDGDIIGCYYCSECGGYASYDNTFCKYCGAKMIEEVSK